MNKILIATSYLTMLFASSGSAFEVNSPGGSNYAWYDVGPQCGSNYRENCGILANYEDDSVREVVKGQLRDMYTYGQRRLRIPVFHRGDGDSKTIMNSGTKANRDRIATNVRNLVMDAKYAGFVEVMIGFFPMSDFNNPISWDEISYNEHNDPYGDNGATLNGLAQQENLQTILAVRSQIQGLIHYRIDLMNEGAPPSNKHRWHWYVARTWSDYVKITRQHHDTVGVSIIVDGGAHSTLPKERYQNMMNAYKAHSTKTPILYSIHAYRDAGGNKDAIEAFDQFLDSQNDQKGWIIGETLYTDPPTQTDFKQANIGNRDVFFVLQWPIKYPRGPSHNGTDMVNVMPWLNYYWEELRKR